MGAKRKALSTRTRFEIFKRDEFTCQYCGQKPPVVILHCDHIAPVAGGGENDALNLITACSECNLGKAAVPLQRKIAPLKNQVALEKERHEQLVEYNKWLVEIRARNEAWYHEISDRIITHQGEDPDEYTVGADCERSIKTFLKKLPASEILEAADITENRVGWRNSFYKAHKYFCAVCWNKIKRPENFTNG